MIAQPDKTQLLDLHARVLTELGPEAAEVLAQWAGQELSDLMAVASQAFQSLTVSPAPPRLRSMVEATLASSPSADLPQRRLAARRRKVALLTGGAALALAGLTVAWLTELLRRTPRWRRAAAAVHPAREG